MTKKEFVNKYVSENYPNLHRELIDLIYGFKPLDANGYDYVDMGEAGKWATCNVGATAPEESGLYFQWGDTQGYTKDQVMNGEKVFNIYDYKFFSSQRLTKYCNDEKSGFTDNLTTLKLADDAAHANMGGDWRMPTKDEFAKLFDLCKHSWVYDYEGMGVDGIVLTLETDMSKTLFFPSTGYAYEGDGVISDKDYTYVWSSSLDTSDPFNGHGLVYTSKDQTSLFSPFDRSWGFSVRGILGVGK